MDGRSFLYAKHSPQLKKTLLGEIFLNQLLAKTNFSDYQFLQPLNLLHCGFLPTDILLFLSFHMPRDQNIASFHKHLSHPAKGSPHHASKVAWLK